MNEDPVGLAYSISKEINVTFDIIKSIKTLLNTNKNMLYNLWIQIIFTNTFLYYLIFQYTVIRV